MSRLEDIQILTGKANKIPQKFDMLIPPCRILNLLTIQDIFELNRIAKDKKLSEQPELKFDMIKNIMRMRGFKKLAAGTNRIVFKHLEDQSIVIKVAYDSVGLTDNLHELYNQELLKPFCTKVFEVTPCGTVGMFERVTPITNRQDFMRIADSVFDILIYKFIGKYIMADIGTIFFMNWGIREGSFPVILDSPYVYELDGAKIYCNKIDRNSPQGFCGGEIDYDLGFNKLVCKKCGKTFLASELKKSKKNKDIIISDKEDVDMIVRIIRGNKVVAVNGEEKETYGYKYDKKGRRKETPYEYRERKRRPIYNVTITRTNAEQEEDTSENKSSYVEQAAAIGNIAEYNHNWDLNSVPEVDAMFKDNDIIIKNAHNHEYNEENTRRLETIIESTGHIVEQEPKPLSDDDIADSADAEETVEEETVQDSDDGYSDTNEEAKKDADGHDKNERYDKAKELVNIIVDKDDYEEIDPAFYDNE